MRTPFLANTGVGLTNDRDFDHMTPIQGDWTINGIGLSADVLRKIYFDNARQLLAGSLPHRTVTARSMEQDFKLTGDLSHPAWYKAEPTYLEQDSKTGKCSRNLQPKFGPYGQINTFTLDLRRLLRH